MPRWFALLMTVALVAIALPQFGAAQSTGDEPLSALHTVAEKSRYTKTARHVEVTEFCRELARLSPRVHFTSMGKSFEDRDLPLLILADPPVKTPAAAARSGKLVVFAMANIHAGEVCGKEALLMLARDLAASAEQPLLDDLIILLAPNHNPDGNERFSAENRPLQNGPAEVGQRTSAQGFDLNRDHVKLESPEARSLARFLGSWNPALAIDCHTTNGSRHRLALTYDGPRHPATAETLVEFTRDKFLPEVRRRMMRATSYRTFYYGNFADNHTTWRTYPAAPRYATHYFGLRNQIGLLSEAYAYAPFRDRVRATYAFVKHCFEMAVDHRQEVGQLAEAARAEVTDWDDDRHQTLGIRFEDAPLETRFVVPGYVERIEDGRRIATDEPRDYEVRYFGEARPTLSVTRPFAYVVPANYAAAIENLRHHGVQLQVLREDVAVETEAYRIDKVVRSAREFQGHHLMNVDVSAIELTQSLAAGSVIVPTSQPLGRLIVTLLEPASQDGLTTWNFFDGGLDEGARFPVLRILHDEPLLTAPYAAPRSEQTGKRRITMDAMRGDRPNFSGRPARGFRWIDDEHYLQTKQGRLYKVHADSGRNELAHDPSPLKEPLQESLGVDERTGGRLLSSVTWNRERSQGFFLHDDDLYLLEAEKGKVRRLTETPEPEELATYSPNERHIGFVRSGDLYVIDVADGEEHRLTMDARPARTNGKADWVYFEEIYGRSWHAFRWSPDSTRILFQQFDDEPVEGFSIPNDLPRPQAVEATRYPLAGQPNPRVRLGVVPATGGAVAWIPTDDYSPDGHLITHFGWRPDGEQIYFYVQDRAQRWLDFNQYSLSDRAVRRLFRDETEAWVDNPGDAHFLDDGSFLITSERSGWKHLYRYDDGELKPVTQGEWEMRQLHVVNEKSGWIYFTGTVDSHLAENLYRLRLSGGLPDRLTAASGHHRVTVSPGGARFLDSFSSRHHPTRVNLHDGDGDKVRTVDTNPVPAIDEYEFAPMEFVKIENRDGFPLEAMIVKPLDFDPARKYPVWLMTYGGPHAPTMSDSWRGGRTYEQMLAEMGIIAFRVDPRSASGKGACSTWTAYRQLGTTELADLEDAVDWLCEKPYVDADRIGMAGHSYGGFLTAFAMTHSDKFAAGISGAPVTDWRNYDTIYTERYMDTPQENPEGYEKTSVVEAAKTLTGRLLILHGARDDNVHLANTLQLVHALQRANKQFEMMIYPPNRHGLFGRHYTDLTLGFIQRTMLGSEMSRRREAGPQVSAE